MKKVMFVCLVLCLCLAAGCGENKEKTAAEAEGVLTDDSVYAELGEDTLWLSVWEYDTFNPVTTKSEAMADCAFLVYDPLFAPDSDMKMNPVLAKDFTVSESGKSYTLRLNTSFKFHDGAPFGSADVVYTIEQLKNLGRESLFYENISNIEKAYAPDSETVVMELYSAESLFINNLCFPIVKAGTSLTQKVEEPVGTGPYKFKKSNLVRAMYFEANEEYALGVPDVKNAVVKLLPEREMQTYAIEARQVDAACVTSSELEDYNPKGGVDTLYYNNRRLTFIGINTTKDFLSYSAVRRAISRGVDRADIVNTVLFGNGEAAVLPYPKESYIYPEEYKDIKKDLTEAAAELDGAGFVLRDSGVRTLIKDDGKKIKAKADILVNSDNQIRVQVAEKVQGALSQLGIEAKITSVSFEDYRERIASGEYDIYIGEIKMDLAYMVTPLAGSSARYSIYASKDLDDAIYNTMTAVGEEKTVGAYKNLSDRLMEEMPVVCLYFGRDAMITNSDLDFGGFAYSGSEFSGIRKWKKQGGV